MKLWTYTRPFSVEGINGVVKTAVTLKDMSSTLYIDDRAVSQDTFTAAGARVFRNNHLTYALPDGRRLDVEAGYVGWWKTQIAVRIDDRLVYESKPGAKIAWPQSIGKTLKPGESLSPEESAKQKAEETRQREQFKRNKPSLIVDLGIGLLFFVVAKMTNLTTAALVSAGAGIIVWIIQRFVKIDLMGGLATFGIVMSLVAAGFAWAFQDDDMVKMRSTILGLLTAGIFLTDGLFGGRYLGQRLVRYMPHPDTSPARLTLGIGLVGVLMAVLNFGVAKLFSTDVWLVYSTFLDTVLALGLTFVVIKWATPKS
ncbi:MAG: septation protein IspZ [Casimicrobium sp.]